MFHSLSSNELIFSLVSLKMETESPGSGISPYNNKSYDARMQKIANSFPRYVMHPVEYKIDRLCGPSWENLPQKRSHKILASA